MDNTGGGGGGKNWLGSKETELQRENLNLEYIKLTAAGSPQPSPGQTLREGNSLPTTAGPSHSPCTWLQAIIDIISKQGIFF